MNAPRLGVVIPTLDEAGRLPALLDDLRRFLPGSEVVVSDGGSADGTPGIARSRGVRVVESTAGRGVQMNAGARALTTPWLLFLHADSRFTADCRSALVDWLDSEPVGEAAHFTFRLDGRGWFWRFIELGQGVREALSGLAYGDQGLVVSRADFEAAGGYPEIPVLEDVEMLKRLGTRCRVRSLPARLPTSPRRYLREGRWTGWLRNASVLFLYLLGVRPETLARLVPGRGGVLGPRPAAKDAPEPEESAESDDSRPPRSSPRPLLAVFAKAPFPGRVKTRLAAEIGEIAAARAYREMGRRVVDGVLGGSYRTVVHFDPPDSIDAVRSWLGTEGLEYRPQAGGDLGARMEAAFRQSFEEADLVCIIGTDAPGVDRAVVEEAFAALEGHDLVLGPALDGGYYLIALGHHRPELFREIPWSTDGVMEATRAIAEDAGLRLRTLDPLVDVDTAADLQAAGL